MAIAFYRVASIKNVVVTQGLNSISYNPGETFYADTNNASVLKLEALHLIVQVKPTHIASNPPIPLNLLSPTPGQGPPGPPGPTGPTGPSGANTAHKIATTGADVVIDTAAPPTTGQVLTATSAVAANWQTPIASGDGIPLTVVAKTTSYLLLSTDAQKIFTNSGAVAQVDFTLPTWALGLSYTISAVAAQTVRIVAPGSDVIRLSTLTSSAGGNFSTGTVGSSVRLVAIASGLWLATSITGSWTPA